MSSMVWVIKKMLYNHEGEFLESSSELIFFSSRFKAEHYCKIRGGKLSWKAGGGKTGNVWTGTYELPPLSDKDNTRLQLEITGHYVN